jgi:hypothetical protein
MRHSLPGLEWLGSAPYWESSLWYAPTGASIHPFHWAIKKMSSYGVDDGLRFKLLTALETAQVKGRQRNATKS